MKRYEFVSTASPYAGIHRGTVTVRDDQRSVVLCLPGKCAWGYEGGGSREAAEAILTDLLGQHPEYPLVRDFVDCLLADEHRARWTLAEAEIRAWLVARPPKPGLETGAVR